MHCEWKPCSSHGLWRETLFLTSTVNRIRNLVLHMDCYKWKPCSSHGLWRETLFFMACEVKHCSSHGLWRETLFLTHGLWIGLETFFFIWPLNRNFVINMASEWNLVIHHVHMRLIWTMNRNLVPYMAYENGLFFIMASGFWIFIWGRLPSQTIAVSMLTLWSTDIWFWTSFIHFWHPNWDRKCLLAAEEYALLVPVTLRL